jgi:hypothetical protein
MVRRVLTGPENAGGGEAKEEAREKLYDTSARSFWQEEQQTVGYPLTKEGWPLEEEMAAIVGGCYQVEEARKWLVELQPGSQRTPLGLMEEVQVSWVEMQALWVEVRKL